MGYVGTMAHTHELWAEYLNKNGRNTLDALPGTGDAGALMRVSSISSIASSS